MPDVELNPGGASDLNDALRTRTGFTTARQTKLDGIATAATANSADATLLARANHTGTQVAGTITGLATVATSGSAADLGSGTLPAARFDDTAHGSRTGGALHANAVAAGAAGFLTGADKAKLDSLGILAFARLDADFTLTSTISAQKIFDSSISTNGEVALTTGLWEFFCAIWITGMSSTSGNAVFSLPVGTAVLSHVWMQSTGVDNANAGVQPVAESGRFATSGSVELASAGAGTAVASVVRGVFRVTTAGLLIPSIALDTAAAATMKAGTCLMARRLGDDSPSLGTWS